MLNSLSGRFLVLTAVFVMLAEVLIFLPSMARFREDYLTDRLERAQIASLALLSVDTIDPDIEAELLANAEVYNVALQRNLTRELILSSPIPGPVAATYDLRDASALILMRDAMVRLVDAEPRLIRVIGHPSRQAGDLIEVTMQSAPLRHAMIEYALRILILSAVISVITAVLLFLAVRRLLVKPIKGVVAQMQIYAEAPEDARRIIKPRSRVRELREAEEALKSLETQLSASLRQKERLAQLGGAVARVSHDLRNILTSAQLFTDRIETSEDPAVKRLAPKLVGSITRAVSLCETTLAFGKAEEPAPVLTQFNLAELVSEVVEAERLAIGEHDLSLSEDIPASLQIRGDPEQLYRVIGNLVRNARQAILGSGQSGEINVAAREDDEAWVIEVTDTGPGLPPKAREHLFKPFQGGARKGGAGLGLAIVAELVRNHGGTLRLARSSEAGSCFEIRLPMGDMG
ncbi:ATPase [Salipiger aestuarii]|uniref:histidine kinase n=1 Tax=Salipiger aestuarii TaxID=568098 RepID=A0A327XUT5_9RHOB|nr:HAMP domain-containing sensor histidine kinase [Salipiger aestuarii]EIE52818.1 sensor histidine kinase [Citreicella sp. 357]KAA8606207.1 ATPase [Salipiger aestuarii]KAB2540870.1 ATPase [Salipiger aestuarii]RAK12423.1 signal transduction histidine kinase [Salipiger aestuarii]